MKLSFFKSLDRISEFSLQLLIMGTVLGCGLYAMALIIFYLLPIVPDMLQTLNLIRALSQTAYPCFLSSFIDSILIDIFQKFHPI